MSYRLEFTRQYLKDLNLARKRGLDEERLNEVIKKIMAGEKLPIKNRDHALSGNYEGFVLKSENYLRLFLIYKCSNLK